jgi:hypothetical protein
LDGTETPFKGSLSNTVVSVSALTRIRSRRVTNRTGKLVDVTRFTLSADGKTMTVFMEDK